MRFKEEYIAVTTDKDELTFDFYEEENGSWLAYNPHIDLREKGKDRQDLVNNLHTTLERNLAQWKNVSRRVLQRYVPELAWVEF